jgi:hypothetical protein
MTGSVLAAVVIPVVTFPALIIWIALVLHADAHPPRRARPAAAGPAAQDRSPRPENAEEPSRTERRAA